MSSKSKSGLFETPSIKSSPATPSPRVRRLSRGGAKSETDSPAPLQNARLSASIDRSPRAANSKPTIERRSTKVTTPDKQPTRIAKESELQAQLSLVQEDLKNAKEQINLMEKEKAQAIDGLKEAQRAAEEANEKLTEALMAQKRAEETSEIEKFRTVELEQAGIEAAQKKEDEWQKELEAVRSQHALDVDALLSSTQELQRVKQELSMTCDAKNQALSHADDATKIAEIHAEKAEILSAELTRLKGLLDSKLGTEASEADKMVSQLKLEIDSLKQELDKVKQELDKAKKVEEKLVEGEASIEQLTVELEAAKTAESYVHNLVEEWKNRVEELEMKLNEANKLERSASESLDSVMKQLEGSNDLLHDAESEIYALKEKVGLLEITIGRQKCDLEESERRLAMAKAETSEMAKATESLKSELETVKEEKDQALNNEKLAASSVQSLLEERNKLMNELEHSRDEEEKSKKAMESLASALHEVSAEGREAKEKLLSSQTEHEYYETQIEDLKLVLKATNQKYETMLDDAKHEVDILISAIEQSKHDFLSSKAEWEQKELHLLNCVKRSEEQNASSTKEVNRLLNLVKEAEDEACATKEEEAHLKDNLREVEAEVIYLQGALGEAKAESMKLKESVLDKETELQDIIQENEDLRSREATSLKKIEELSKLLEEAMAVKQTEENGDLTDSEKDYDLLPKVVEFTEENGHGGEEKPKLELLSQKYEEPKKENGKEENTVLNSDTNQITATKLENVNGKPKKDKNKEKEDGLVEVEFQMWESCKIEKKEFSPDREPEQESFDDEVDSKHDGGESLDQTNGISSTETVDDGAISPTKQQQHKKKKPLLRKFGNLLKKKGSSNQK